MKKIIRMENGNIKVQTINNEPSMAQEHFKDEVDINNIMKKYQKVGISYNHLPQSSKGLYGDFTAVKTFEQAHQAILDTEKNFSTLPSQIRKRFDNNPQQLINFLNDKQNRDEAIQLGLIPKPPTPEPTPTT